MITVLRGAAALALLVWVYLLLARGGFWRVPRVRSPDPQPPLPPRRVVAVIPARDEAPVIAVAVESLLRQRFAGSIELVVVDDGSADDTAGAARAAAARVPGASQRLTVLRGAPLAAGWTGKLWAMSQGLARAHELNPDFLLLTDADIRHDPDNVASLVARADAQGLDLVSYMVKLSVASFPERCLIPAFVFFFFKLYPPAWVASPRLRTAAAAGGCMLVRPQALARIGGLQSLRSQIIDDCALARAIKGGGGSIQLSLTRTAQSVRSYGTFGEIGRLISRTAFSQLRHSYGLLVATLAGLAVTYLLAPLLLVTGDGTTIACAGAAWALMSVAYLPMVRFYGLGALWSLTLPAVAVFYGGATAHSAIQYALGRGGNWKGRAQDLRA